MVHQPYRGNDASCVLRVQTATQTILLPGDIERRSERLLLADNAAQLPSDILVAPHHGSTTSSTAAFVRTVDPSMEHRAVVIAPVACRLRKATGVLWGHFAAATVALNCSSVMAPFVSRGLLLFL